MLNKTPCVMDHHNVHVYGPLQPVGGAPYMFVCNG